MDGRTFVTMFYLLVHLFHETKAPNCVQEGLSSIELERIRQTWYQWKVHHQKFYPATGEIGRFCVFSRNYEKVPSFKWRIHIQYKQRTIGQFLFVGGKQK